MLRSGLVITGRAGKSQQQLAGVADCVLLEEVSEDSLLANFKTRFANNAIYTYIGDVLVAINPYHELGIYTSEDVQDYRDKNLFEMPPHIFAIADETHRSMRERSEDQCVIISGESGSGKTESSKKIMQFIVSISGDGDVANVVKEQLLQSNPVLEAFGNAKTLRNDNSSRFGKYMDMQFDFKGTPVGGDITNYLLEKSRVVGQTVGERSFHIFYQLLAGAPDPALAFCKLSRDPRDYRYLRDSECFKVASIDDKQVYAVTKHGMDLIGFEPSEISLLFSLLACILHIGNVDFVQDPNSEAAVLKDRKSLDMAAGLIKLPFDEFLQALTHRTIETGRESVRTPLNRTMALFARDALAKSLYDRMFTWVVQRINTKLRKSREDAYGKQLKKTSVIGVLDIYGFEIFVINSFEQFVINHCNEKLQQIFIELTLRSEQEEYLSEGIEWTTVEYFNNRIICDLIEKNNEGILAMLDDMCLRPGKATDATFLEELNQRIGKHPHFDSFAKSKNRDIGYDCFRLRHYAGDVDYNTVGFMEKNRDLLFKDLKMACFNAEHALLKACFSDAVESDDVKTAKGFGTVGTSKKRPPTAGAQFKISMQSLMDNLLSKTPHYIRCIKPNDEKKAHQFDSELVRHQTRYLGLLENVRVRRAGYAFRQVYERFHERYRMLSREVWPYWTKVKARDATLAVLRSLKIPSDGYAFGKTKVFVRKPRTVFQLEEARREGINRLITQIQAVFKGWRQWRLYKRMRAAAILIEAQWRGYVARTRYKLMKRSAIKIQSWTRRYLVMCKYERKFKKWAIPIVGRFMLCWFKVNYLQTLARLLPSGSPIDDSYPPAPPFLNKTSLLLEDLHHQWRCRNYIRPKIWAAPIITRFVKQLVRYKFLVKLSKNLPSWSPIDKRWPKAPPLMQHASEVLRRTHHLMRCRAYARPRVKAAPILQRFMRDLQRYRWLSRLAAACPTLSPIDKKWPTAPRNLVKSQQLIVSMHHRYRCQLYALPRYKAEPVLKRFFANLQRYRYLIKAAKSWPSMSPIDNRWPSSSKNLAPTHQLLVIMYHQYRCREYARPRATAAPIIQRFMKSLQVYLFLTRLAKNLPSKSPIDRKWPLAPRNLKQTSDILRNIYHLQRCREYAAPRARAAPVLIRFFQALQKYRWLMRLVKGFPSNSPTDHRWPPAPKNLTSVSNYIRNLHHQQRCQGYAKPRVTAIPVIAQFMKKALVYRWLTRVYIDLPSDSPADRRWPAAPKHLWKTSALLEHMHHKWRCREYIRTRAWAIPVLIRFFLVLQKRLYLQRLARSLPSEYPGDKSWPKSPLLLVKTDTLLQDMFYRQRIVKYCAPRIWAAPILCRFMRNYQIRHYLQRLRLALPSDSPIDKRWMKPPANLRETSNLLRAMHHLWRCRKFASPRAKAAPIIINFMKRVMRFKFLMRLSTNLPSMSPIDKRWMKPPAYMRKTSNLLQLMHHQWRCRIFARPIAKAAPIIIRFMKLLQIHLFLKRLAKSLPDDSPLDKRWMKAPRNLVTPSAFLRVMHHTWRCRKYARPRAKAAPILQRFMRQLQKALWLYRLRDSLPSESPCDKGNWPSPPPKNFVKVSEELERLHHRWRCRKFRLALSANKKKVFREKLFASELFRGKKRSYEASVPVVFKGDRFGLTDTVYVGMWNVVQSQHQVKKLVHTQAMNKINRTGGGVVPLLIAVTDHCFLFIKESKKSLSVQHTLPFEEVLGISTSELHDGTVVIHVKGAEVGALESHEGTKKGDYILEVGYPIEFITKAATSMRTQLKKPVNINISNDITYVAKGKRFQMLVQFSPDHTLTQTQYVPDKKSDRIGFRVMVPQRETPITFNAMDGSGDLYDD